MKCKDCKHYNGATMPGAGLCNATQARTFATTVCFNGLFTPKNGKTNRIARPGRNSATPLNKRAVITIGAAFLITFAFDRLICSIPPTWLIGYELPVFWIICALTVTALHWKTARKQVLVWLVLGSIVAIGVWNTLAQPTWCYSRNDEYALTTQFVQPALLMLHCQLVNGRYDVRRPLQVAWNWLTGWLQQPFIHIRDFAEPFSVIFARFAVASKQRSKVREIGIALLISTPLLLTIVPLLIGADQIVQYEVLNVFSDFNPMTITLHIMFIVLPWPLLFSLLIGLDDRTHFHGLRSNDSPSAR